MKTIALPAKTSLEEVIAKAGDEELLVLRDGHPVALVTPFDEDDMEWYAIESSPEFIASIARARKQAAEGKKISHAELKRKLGVR